MVYSLQLTCDEIVDILDVKYIAASTERYILAPCFYEVTDINMMVKSLLPNDVRVKITIADFRLKSNFTINKSLRFTIKSFFFIILGFTESHSGLLGDIGGFVQLIPGNYESNKHINITGIDELHLKYDCISGSIVNGTREPILYPFALSSLPVHKKYKTPRIKLPKKK